jgi:tight adherence protein C
MNLLPILIIALVAVVGAVILVIVGLQNPHAVDERALMERLELFEREGQEVNLEDIELAQPFTERVILPLARKLGEVALRFTPQNLRQSIDAQLEQAGNIQGIDATLFLAMQFFLLLLFGGLVFLALSFGSLNWSIGRALVVSLAFGLLGFLFPQLWIRSKISTRQKNILKAMPDALDLLTICVESGLGFDAAMAKVSEKMESELAFAFARVIREIQLGKTRREALRDMSDRINVQEMTSFIAAVLQSEQLGVSLSKVLRIQSDQMRVRRRQRAEEAAHKAPLKMLIPMTLLIFPSLIIVLLTPAALRLIDSALGGMF